MMLLAGGASFFIGNAYQAQMPGFADDLGVHNAGSRTPCCSAPTRRARSAPYCCSKARQLAATPGLAQHARRLWCIAMGGFALAHGFALALPCCSRRFLRVSFQRMAQTIVQMRAPADQRGRFIGLFNMASLGLRAFSGVTVGLGGTWSASIIRWP